MNKIIFLTIVIFICFVMQTKPHLKKEGVIITGREYHNIVAYNSSALKKSTVLDFAKSISKLYPQFDTIFISSIPRLSDSALYTVIGTTIIILELRHNRQIQLSPEAVIMFIDTL